MRKFIFFIIFYIVSFNAIASELKEKTNNTYVERTITIQKHQKFELEFNIEKIFLLYGVLFLIAITFKRKT